MKYFFMPFWGVPCCQGLSSQHLQRIWRASKYLTQAQGPIQADLLFVVGHVTHKQSPYLQNMWAEFTYPARCIHFVGCKSVLQNYALVDRLTDVINVDVTIDHCRIDLGVIESALQDAYRKVG